LKESRFAPARGDDNGQTVGRLSYPKVECNTIQNESHKLERAMKHKWDECEERD